MGVAYRKRIERPRELRRRVVLPARLCAGADWSDTCILNVSSRGLMIHSSRPAFPGSVVELRRGEHVIVARVMWRDGARLGLQAEERVPVEEILSLSNTKSLQLAALGGALIERRKEPRLDPDGARSDGRWMEFLATIAAAAIFAGCAWSIAHQALAKPLAAAQVALAN
jgi:hypothetical protein